VGRERGWWLVDRERDRGRGGVRVVGGDEKGGRF
jgi:hypothetical protein